MGSVGVTFCWICHLFFQGRRVQEEFAWHLSTHCSILDAPVLPCYFSSAWTGWAVCVQRLANPRCSLVPASCAPVVTHHGKVRFTVGVCKPSVQWAHVRPGTLMMCHPAGHELYMCISAEEDQGKSMAAHRKKHLWRRLVDVYSMFAPSPCLSNPDLFCPWAVIVFFCD